MLKKGVLSNIDRRSSGWVQKGCNLTAERMQKECKQGAIRAQQKLEIPAQECAGSQPKQKT